MDRGRAVLAVGTGLIALTLTAACAAPETTPAAAPVTVTVTTAAPPASSTPTPTPAATQRPSAKPTKPVGLLSKPPTTKPKLPPITKKPTTKPTVKKPTTKPTTRRTTTKPPVSDAYYANCSEVRAAGAAPIHAGDPGYSRKLDRDGDGIACEN
ncbi:excalibur calcium-binding domain-containing protein [Kribbella italica]|uniref:Outer membrane biosynthesis protein TonB n=1 Tax=Kribbella italica TaxID=1540520 RepID=A0A7W9J7X5_9ACTN|nr:excalibur calcium-binding domain-containing protein [Kribbella italica]MBB5837173.1 outer membrane biosynthesis protein TonB [Kribbella italica]